MDATERMNQPEEKRTPAESMLAAIGYSLRIRGGRTQRVFCALMMFVLSFAALPGGYYACQIAMFAVLLRMGALVPAAFAGVCAGFAAHFSCGNMIACWQLPQAIFLWLGCGIWTQRQGCGGMAAAVFLSAVSAAAVADVRAPVQIAALLLTSAAGAGLALLYEGAALCAVHKDELDGDTRPLCVMAVCASLAAGIEHLPLGDALALAFAAYLTLEHAFLGGGAQGVLCGGVMGGVLSVCMLRPEPAAMLVCGGFLAGEVRTEYRGVSALLMALAMACAAAVLGAEEDTLWMLLCACAGMTPFLVLPARLRSPVTGLIEHAYDPEVTQSDAIAVRCAGMIHAWAGLYEQTAGMMRGLLIEREERTLAQECVELLEKTSAAAHQVCERTLSQIRPDDSAFRAVRFALVRAGLDDVRAAYALRSRGKLEVMLLKPEHVAPAALAPLISRACGVPVSACSREGLLSTQALFEQTPAFALEIGASLRSRTGEVITGDAYISRVLPGGRHVLALSDGMGCGADAMAQSHMALTLIADSLRAGYTREQALSVVNRLMLMCTGRELYATMDLCVINLHTGEAAFEKLGACASFVVREKEVRTLGAQSLPIGMLGDVQPESARLSLCPGDMLIMMSDGVLLSYPGGEEALGAAAAELAWLHPQAVCERLIAQALDGGEATDDMAVVCARLGKKRGE